MTSTLLSSDMQQYSRYFIYHIYTKNPRDMAAYALCTLIFCAIIASLILWVTIWPHAHAQSNKAAADPYRAIFKICSGPKRSNCVVDGDTFWFDAGSGPRKIRIADINTPELNGAQCDAERALGHRAKWRLLTLLNSGEFSLQSIARDKDRYGRDLRILMRDGRSIGNILIHEGLAEHWQGYKREWC